MSGIKAIPGGNYYHFGLKNQLLAQLARIPELLSLNTLSIQVNIDGLPLFKSTNGSFLPILGKILNFKSAKPFVIGMFFGNSKPESAEVFLEDFVDEMEGLDHKGKRF